MHGRLQSVHATDDETYLSQIILGFEWRFGYGDHSPTEEQIVAALNAARIRTCDIHH